MMSVYNADIIETAARDGCFTATLRGSPITATGPDPEYSLALAMAEVGLPDGSIQFWRGATPSLRFGSTLRAAQCRIAFEEDGYRLRKRRERPAIFARDRATGVTQNRERRSGGELYHPAPMGFPESPRTICEAAE